MAFRKRDDLWAEDALLDVCHKHYISGKTQKEIADEINTTRQMVAKMLDSAKALGIVEIRIAPTVETRDLRETEEELRNWFPWLQDVILVRGHPPVEDTERMKFLTDGVLRSLADACAAYLSKRLENGITIAVGSGTLVQSVVSAVQIAEPLNELKIVPLHGSFGTKHSPTDADILAGELHHATGGHYFWLPIPALVRNEHKMVVRGIPIVRSTLNRTHRATFVLTNIGALTKQKEDYLRRAGFVTRGNIDNAKAYKPVGEIGGRLFDINGADVPTDWTTIGMSIERIREIVNSRVGRVVGVVGADNTRIDAVLGALRGKIINTLVTDHITAREILKRCGPRTEAKGITFVGRYT